MTHTRYPGIDLILRHAIKEGSWGEPSYFGSNHRCPDPRITSPRKVSPFNENPLRKNELKIDAYCHQGRPKDI